MMEIWKDIPGYEGLYQVSNMGQVRSLDVWIKSNNPKSSDTMFRKGRVLRQYARTGGYLNVCLSKDGKVKPMRVHRLVAQAFIPNPNNYPEVNHIDHSRTNNCVDNLEWCTRQYNFDYSGVRYCRAFAVDQLTMDGEYITTYYSQREAARAIGGHGINISLCCRGLASHAYGYKWRRSSDEQGSKRKRP